MCRTLYGRSFYWGSGGDDAELDDLLTSCSTTISFCYVAAYQLCIYTQYNNKKGLWKHKPSL